MYNLTPLRFPESNTFFEFNLFRGKGHIGTVEATIKNITPAGDKYVELQVKVHFCYLSGKQVFDIDLDTVALKDDIASAMEAVEREIFYSISRISTYLG